MVDFRVMVNTKNKYFRPPVGAVSNRTDLACLINSKIHYNYNEF